MAEAAIEVPCAHQRIPRTVESALGVVDALVDSHGGSSATVWKVRTRDGCRLVVKVLEARAGLVDGHDLDSFVRKPSQIRAVHEALPGLSPYYTEVTGEWTGKDWAAYAMPHYEGRPITSALEQEKPDVDGFLRDVTATFAILTEFGYAHRWSPAPPEHFRATHLNRVMRRLPLLRDHLEPELFADEPITVNGRRCRSLPRLLDSIGADEELMRRLRPARLGFPVHGDLNLGNLLVRRGAPDPDFTVLDPRGELGPWDAVYDFAKSMFSLTVFERAMASGLDVARVPGTGGREYRVSFQDGYDGYLRAAEGYVDALAGIPFFRRLDEVDPHWRTRLLFAHAFHCVAESACRLSDRKPRTYGDVGGWDACVLLSRGLLLFGIALLDELLDSAATP